MFDRVWQFYKKIAQRIGRFQTILLVTILYFVAVPVFSLVRLLDPLRLKLYQQKRKAQTYWQPRPPMPKTLPELRRQG